MKSWLICDGDVDPEWIESLNSVLDDNHLLTLPNGERISFGNNVNFVFETHDLKFASPATVSRMGERKKASYKNNLKHIPARPLTVVSPGVTVTEGSRTDAENLCWTRAQFPVFAHFGV